MQNDKIILNVIPVLKSGNILVKEGQVCTGKTASLMFYSALSCGHAYYTNIEGEDPITEADIIDSGRGGALTGYGTGLTVFSILDGGLRWKPIRVLQFLDMVKLSKKPEIGDEIMPVVLRPDKNGTALFNVDTGEENKYSPVKGIELLANLQNACSWVGISCNTYISRLRNVLKDCVIGWPSSFPDARITEATNVDAGALSVFRFYKDSSDLINILNSRVMNILPC